MKTNHLSHCIALGLASGLYGCAIVSSQPAGTSTEGIAYMLPKALLPVTLTDRSGALELAVGEPVQVGDTARTYVLRRSGNIFTSDNTTINVDPKTGLLTAADVKSEDKTLPAVIELLKGTARAEAADVAPAVVFRGLFDPGASQDEVDKFNNRINAAARVYVARLLEDGGCDKTPKLEACAGAARLNSLVSRGSFGVSVQGADAPEAAPADCSAGLCYRLNVPHVVTLSGPLASNSAVFGLPNRSPTFVLPLERWAFVKTSHDVKLEDGVFKSVTTDRPSSALAVAAAPVAAASAVLAAAAQILQLKVDLSGKETALANAKVAEITAKSALDKALLDKAGGKAEAAILGGDSHSRDKLLSIVVGRVSPQDATADVVVPGQTATQRPAPVAAPVPAPAASAGAKTSPANPGKK